MNNLREAVVVICGFDEHLIVLPDRDCRPRYQRIVEHHRKLHGSEELAPCTAGETRNARGISRDEGVFRRDLRGVRAVGGKIDVEVATFLEQRVVHCERRLADQPNSHREARLPQTVRVHLPPADRVIRHCKLHVELRV